MTLRQRIADWLAPAKASTGIGAVWMEHNPHLSAFVKDPSKAMKQAEALGISNLYIRAAERVIGERFSTIPWHLEAPGSDEVIENDAIIALFEKPYAPAPGDPATSTPRTRSALWRLTCRHLGLTGNAFWYLDQSDALGGFPLQVLYINPARMTPAEDRAGNLLGWVLDADLPGRGIPLEAEKVLHFKLEPADTGHYGVGLVESAFSRAEMLRLADKHANEVLASGGRLAGVFSPPANSGAIPDDQYEQLVKDLRTVAERPDAARRSVVLKGPIEFDKTVANPSELDLAGVASLGMDGILHLWGVPETQLGARSAAGLNSGETRKYDEATLWQNAVGPRLRAFRETIQFQLLDRLEPPPELVLEEPEFDDEAPRYDLAQKAMNLPLTNAERREIVGKEPLGIPEIDDAIWLPISIVPAGQPRIAPPVKASADDAAGRAIPGVDRVRRQMTESIEQGVADVLERMGAEVAERVARNAEHLARKPNDDQKWWDEAKWHDELLGVIRPAAALAAQSTHEVTQAMLEGTEFAAKADLRDSVLARLLAAVGDRIGGILGTTRKKVQATIADGIADGLGAAELGKAVEESAGFRPYRAEMIARTETNRVLNLSQLYTYDEYGVDRVEAIDGDDDPECAARDGLIVTTREAENIHDHPNGTLDWSPYFA